MDGDEFDARPGEELVAIEPGTECPLVLVLIPAEEVALAFGSARFEIRTIGRLPLVYVTACL
jgi:hypothetical protein